MDGCGWFWITWVLWLLLASHGRVIACVLALPRRLTRLVSASAEEGGWSSSGFKQTSSHSSAVKGYIDPTRALALTLGVGTSGGCFRRGLLWIWQFVSASFNMVVSQSQSYCPSIHVASPSFVCCALLCTAPHPPARPICLVCWVVARLSGVPSVFSVHV